MAFGLGVLTQKFLIDRVLKAPAVAQIFLTVGLLIVMENLALILFGSEFRSVRTPYQMSALSIGPILLSVPYLLACSVATAAGLALWWVLKRRGGAWRCARPRRIPWPRGCPAFPRNASINWPSGWASA